MQPPNLTRVSEGVSYSEEPSNFELYGEGLMPDLSPEEYDEYIRSYREFDL